MVLYIKINHIPNKAVKKKLKNKKKNIQDKHKAIDK